MITEEPEITVQIRPKNCESDSDSNTVSINNSWKVDITTGHNGRNSIQKQVRFSCPSDGSNEISISHNYWKSRVASNHEEQYDFRRNSNREKRIPGTECSNESGNRKKVRMQHSKNIRNKFSKNRTNCSSEHEVCRKLSCEQRPRKEPQKLSFVDLGKNTKERHRVQIHDVPLAKERESIEKTPGEISLPTRENSRLAHREVSRDKGPRNGFQKNIKGELQRKLQNIGGQKVLPRKNTLAGEDARKSTKKPDTKKVANKILTTSIKHFAKYIEACRKQYLSSDDTQINHHNDLGDHKIDGASNIYESTNTNSQATCGNDSKMYSRNEILKDTGNVEENMWKANQGRDDVEKIAIQIRNDLEKNHSEDNETTDGEFIKNIIGDAGILCDGSPLIEEGSTKRWYPFNGNAVQKNARINSETKVMDNQRHIKHFRRRNSSSAEVRDKTRMQYGDSIPQSSSALFSPKKVQYFPTPSHRLRSTRESNRRCRHDAWYGSNIWQKNIKSSSDRLDVSFQKKDAVGIQDVFRSNGNENSRISTSKKCRDSIHELRSHSFKYIMDDPQKNFGAWKYGKNDRDIFRKNYINSASKSNLEEVKHRIGIFSSKTELGSLHRKESDAFGKGYREALHRSVRDSGKSDGDGPEKSFWDIYRTNIQSSERKAPWDTMLNTSGYAHKESRDKSRKSIRGSSQKGSRDFARKLSPPRKDIGDDPEKTNIFEYLRSGDASSSRIQPLELGKNVCTDHKKSSSIDVHNVTFASKNVHDHRKRFTVCSRKNEPASKNVGDVPSSIFSAHASKLSRFEHGKSVSPFTSKSGWELGVSRHGRSTSPKGRATLPAPSAALRFASFRTHSPEDLSKWNIIKPRPFKSTSIQSHSNGCISHSSIREGTTKTSTNLPRKHPFSADPKVGRSKVLREHAWKAFGTFPWPAQSVHSAHNVRHNPSRHVLGESKSNALVFSVANHAESRVANMPICLHRKERHPSRSHGNSGYRPLKRSLEKTHFRSFQSSECLAANEHGDEFSGKGRDKIFPYRPDVTRTANEEDVDANEKDSVQYVGEDVSDCGRLSARRSLRTTAWNSYPWVVRSTWGIQDEPPGREVESARATPPSCKESLKSRVVNPFSSGCIAPTKE